MIQIDLDALLAEISADAPCGEDISYDVDFLELERLAEGTEDTQVGDHIREGEEPDWKQVGKLSLELLARSRDLRLILYLTAAALRLEGLAGFNDGLTLLCGIVERYWEQVYPQLDPEDDNDPLERMNIISSLSPPATVMSDQDTMKFIPRLMAVPLCMPEDPRLPNPSLREILIATGEISTPEEEDSHLPSMQIIDAAFEQTDIDGLQATNQVLEQCLQNLAALDQMLLDYVGSTAAPNFSRLEKTLKQMQSKASDYMARRGYATDAAADAGADNGDSPAEEGSSSKAVQQGLSGQISAKEDVLKALDMVVGYYERDEPSSPVPLIIKRAKRLVGKSFVDIIRDLSPDAISQVRVVTGEDEEYEQ